RKRGPRARQFSSVSLDLNFRLRFLIDEPDLKRLDLQREIAREDPALREAPGREPQAWLRRAPPHVAQFAAVVITPHWSGPFGNRVAQIEPGGFLLVLVAGRQHQEFGGEDASVAHPCSFWHEGFDVI